MRLHKDRTYLTICDTRRYANKINMNAKELVTCWKLEKEDLLNIFTSSSERSVVANKIVSLKISHEQQVIMKKY